MNQVKEQKLFFNKKKYKAYIKKQEVNYQFK